jgi:hypothetical protein
MMRLSQFLSAIVLSASLAVGQVPASSHVFLLVEENTSYSSVAGNWADMPYLNSLIIRYGLATEYYANTHPSIGNYFVLTAGQPISNDDTYNSTVTEDNIVRELLLAGKTWKAYAESLPWTGYTGFDTNLYAKRHNPLAYFADVTSSAAELLNLVPFSQFAVDLAGNQLPNYSFLVPNLTHDAHDCPPGMAMCTESQKLAAADQWLRTNLEPLINSQVFQQDGLLIIVFDESAETDILGGGGHVAWVVVGPRVRPGYQSVNIYQHQSTLRLTCSALGLGSCPGAGAAAPDMGEFFLPPAVSWGPAATSNPPGVRPGNPRSMTR